MKKLTIKMLAIFMTMMSASIIIQPYDKMIKSSQNRRSYKNLKRFKIIPFTPDEAFGGDQAQGKYIIKNQTATIIHNDKVYSFTNIIKRPTNPYLPTEKNLDENLVLIGLFSNSTNRSEMPVITYLFGIQTKTENNTEQLSEKQIQNRIGSNPSTYAPIKFQPGEEFSGDGLIGNYFKNNHIATIHDPSGKSDQSYSFEKVEESELLIPEGLILIGSYLKSPYCPAEMMCATVMTTVNLYGLQVKNQAL